MTTYTYLGDKHTDPALRSMTFTAIRRPDGKCIRGKSNMLVRGSDGRAYVVLGRRLRKVNP